MNMQDGHPINSAKRKMLRGEPALGTSCVLGSNPMVETLSFGGFDFVMIDLQHGLHFDMGDEKLLPSDDFPALQQAGAAGYTGIGEVRDATGVRLRYVRHLHHDRAPW